MPLGEVLNPAANADHGLRIVAMRNSCGPHPTEKEKDRQDAEGSSGTLVRCSESSINYPTRFALHDPRYECQGNSFHC